MESSALAPAAGGAPGDSLPATVVREGRTLRKVAYGDLGYQGSWNCDLCAVDKVCFQPGAR